MSTYSSAHKAHFKPEELRIDFVRSSKSCRLQFCAMSRWAHAHNCSWADAHLLIKLQCCSITRHFCTVSANGMSCQFCGKQFNRGYNLRRHEKEYCPLRAQERNMSQTDSDIQETDFQVQLMGLKFRRRLIMSRKLKKKWTLGYNW